MYTKLVRVEGMNRDSEKRIVFSLGDLVEKASLPSLDHTYAPKVTSETKMNTSLFQNIISYPHFYRV